MADEEKQNPHCATRHSFIALFTSRHLKTMKKPDSLQQCVKAEEEKTCSAYKKLLFTQEQKLSNQDGYYTTTKHNQLMV